MGPLDGALVVSQEIFVVSAMFLGIILVLLHIVAGVPEQIMVLITIGAALLLVVGAQSYPLLALYPIFIVLLIICGLVIGLVIKIIQRM